MEFIFVGILIVISITLGSINYKLGKVLATFETIVRIGKNLQTAGIISAILGKSDEERLSIFWDALRDALGDTADI